MNISTRFVWSVALNGIFTGGILHKQDGASTNDASAASKNRFSVGETQKSKDDDASVAHQVIRLIHVAFERNVCLLAH